MEKIKEINSIKVDSLEKLLNELGGKVCLKAKLEGFW